VGSGVGVNAAAPAGELKNVVASRKSPIVLFVVIFCPL